MKYCKDPPATTTAPAPPAPPPAPPAPLRGEELSSGAVGGVVVGAYLGVAAIAGAAAASRGVAAGV